MREPDTRQLALFGSGAAASPSDRLCGVLSANDGRTPPTAATRGSRTSTTATRTTTTSATSTERGPSAAWADAALSFSELLAAWRDCRRTKRSTPAALAFEEDLEQNLAALFDELVTGTYAIGPSTCFAIRWPKRREVWAAGFRDRVVHHLLYNKIAPRFERAFIADSCACIEGRGTGYAVRRLEGMVRAVTQNWSRPAHYLKLDLASFFPSIDKRILAARLERKIPEPFWRALALQVLFHDPRPGAVLHGRAEDLARIAPEKSLFNRPAHLGLPIGNLSSQFGANVYLDALDQFVKHALRARHYVRYVDDFVLLHESPAQLGAWHAAIAAFLPRALGVRLNESKTVRQPIARGIDFCGMVVRPHRTTLRPRTLNGALERLAAIPAKDVPAAANSYLGLARQASAGFTARARIANVARRRGFAVDHHLTKVYA